MMTLLTVLDSLSPSDPNQQLLASSIQILCTSNLHLSRLRRSSMSRFVKHELKQPLFSQKVTHLHLFGEDIDSSANNIVKSQSSIQKMLIQPKPAPKNTKNTHSTSGSAPSTSRQQHSSMPSSSRSSSPSRSRHPPQQKRTFQPYKGQRGQSRHRGGRSHN